MSSESQTAGGPVDPALPTGIEILDRKLDGGLPCGATVALSASPASQSEVLLYELTRERPTLYLTSRRTSSDVARAVERCGGRRDRTAVRELSPADPLAHANALVRELTGPATVIVDPMDPLEQDDDGRLGDFLNALGRHLRGVGGVAFLHCLDAPDAPGGRTTTQYMADAVFDLSTERMGESVVSRLTVPKFRGGRPPNEVIKLELNEAVSVDISRDIG